MVVDDFIERLLVNKTLNANPAIKAARERSQAGAQVPRDHDGLSGHGGPASTWGAG